MPVSLAKRLELDERRAKVAALYLQKVTQEEIGRRLGIPQQYVSRDIQVIREEYRRDRLEVIDRELAGLDAMEEECCVQYARTSLPEWIVLRVRICERRAKLLGLDAPARVEASGRGGGPLEIVFVNDWRGGTEGEE